MRKTLFALGLAAAVAGFTGLYGGDMAGMGADTAPASKTVTVTGTLVDVMCYLEEGATGNDHDGMKACGTACLKGGSPAGVLVGKKLYNLAFPAPVFMDYVGMTVEFSGKAYLGDQLIPSRFFVIKDGKKTEVNIKGKSMM